MAFWDDMIPKVEIFFFQKQFTSRSVDTANYKVTYLHVI